MRLGHQGRVAGQGRQCRQAPQPAALTGDPALVVEAREALDAVECPPGGAWVTGADVYLLLGSVEPLSRAIDGTWPSLRRLLPGQSTSSTS